jgi:cell division septum initiation protein DivIVA
VPEEKFASSEHELIQEITAPFAAVRENSEADPGEADFPVVLRGYDRVAVDAYIRRTRQVIDDLRATSSPEAAVRRALERVGEEVSGILQRAHETAEKITGQSRSEAEDRLEAARGEAGEIRAEAARELDAARRDAAGIRAQAEQQLTDLDAETDRIWAERHRIVEDARELARQLEALANAGAERFPPAEDTETGETMPAQVETEDETVVQEEAPVADEPEEARPYDHAEGSDDDDDATQATQILPPPEH